MTAYYNEHDPYAAEWLRNLIARGLIAPGEVDERDILDVTPAELFRFDQWHFFAGIGVWPYALRLIGWPDNRPIGTGSCPCQPFSAAGKREGVADERHLWPAFHWLIDKLRPPVVTGEQVASADGLAWLDTVSADMENSGYAFGAVDLCAAGFGMVDWEESQAGEWLRRSIRHCTDPIVAGLLRDFAAWAGGNIGEGGDHIRQRAYFVGLADRESGGSRAGLCDSEPPEERRILTPDGGPALLMGDTERPRFSEQRCEPGVPPAAGGPATGQGTRGADSPACPGGSQTDPRRPARDWLICRDGRGRAVEAGTFPLAHEAPARVGKLRSFGNALDGETVTGFLEVVKEIVDGRV
jgi:DNA (cytosine-5)-methyltransferase 1